MFELIYNISYRDDSGHPTVEMLHNTKFGIIHSTVSSGTWDGLESECKLKAYNKYIQLLREKKQLIEA